MKTEAEIITCGIISNSKGPKFGVNKKELDPIETFEFFLGRAVDCLWRYKFNYREEDIINAERYLNKAEMLCSKYSDDERFNEAKIKLDQIMELYKMAKQKGEANNG